MRVIQKALKLKQQISKVDVAIFVLAMIVMAVGMSPQL